MLVWIWFAVAFAVGYFWLKKRYAFFKDKGIKHYPVVPIFGNMYRQLTRQEHMSSVVDTIYHAFPNDRFIGTFELISPVLTIRDPDLLRSICIKDFDHFQDHRAFSNGNDLFFSKSLIGLKGQKWRDMRSTLSPAFTGSKLRNMVPLIHECNKDLVSYVREEINRSGKSKNIDTQDLLTRYTNDVIATCAFGVQSNSINDKNNLFYSMASKITTFNMYQVFKLFIAASLPFIHKIVELQIFPEDATAFLRHVVLSTIKNRDDNNINRPDVIQLLLEAKKGILQHEKINDEKDGGFATVEESYIGKSTIKQVWSDEDLVAQAFLFFFAGFDTVSTCMKLLLLELAINTDCQNKLRQEINEYHQKYDGKIDYDKVNQMKYMDMVISEVLRKWPPAIATDRLCVKKYNLGKPNEKSTSDFIMEKGMILQIPIMAIQRDPKYYENPDKFDPERFSDENKHKINPFAYMPFGLGPRNCIGSRFALIEVKLMVYELIRHFEISPAPQTILPPRYDKKSVQAKLEGGHWLNFKCIK